MGKDKKQDSRTNLVGLPLAAIVKQLNAKYGANTLAIASKAVGIKIRFLSTGVYSLDFGLGGGIPENRITEIRGNFSVLKTTVCNNTIANFQKKYPRGLVFYEDGERSFDTDYAVKCGCDPDRICLINPDSGEQAVDVLNDLLTIGDIEILIVVDSVASLVPAAETESSMDQQFQGLHARLVNRMMRVVTAGMKRNLYDVSAPSLTIVATNQLREKIGVLYGNPETTPGGKGKDFYYSTMIRLNSSPSDRIMDKIVRNGITREVRVGQNVSFTVTKNKVSSSQFEQGEFTYFVRPYKGHDRWTFNNEEVLTKYALFYGLLGKGRLTYGPINAANEQKFRVQLLQHPKVARQLYEEVLEAVLQEEDLVKVKAAQPVKARKLLFRK